MTYIHKFNTFNENIQLLKEGLIRSNDIDSTTNHIKNVLNKVKIKHELTINYSNNTFDLKLLDFNYIQLISNTVEILDSVITNINGWFPSQCIIYKFSNQGKAIIWHDNMYKDLVKNCDNISDVIIRYEAKFDKPYVLSSNLIYHITNTSAIADIIKTGLSPKAKSQLTMHPDRIYLTEDPKKCEALFITMRAIIWGEKFKNAKNVKPESFVLLEIDLLKFNSSNIDFYTDPNFNGGFYITKNIPKEAIKIIKTIE